MRPVNAPYVPAPDAFFTCQETPLKLPDTTTLPVCGSCTLRLTSLIPGDGKVSADDQYNLGLDLNENPQTTLAVNGIQYNLRTSILTFPAAHMLPGETVRADAELLISFASSRDGATIVYLALPVKRGAGGTNRYFSTLGPTPSTGRPALQTLFASDAQFVQYSGPQIFGRTPANDAPNNICAPVSPAVHFVCTTPAYMLDADYGRLKRLAGASVGPPPPTAIVAPERLRMLCSVVNGIRLGAPPSGSGAGAGGVDMSAMKCFRLDPDRDIRDGKIYVGGSGGTALQTELSEGDAAGTMDLPLDTSAGKIQKWAGIVLGVLLGLAVVFVIVAFVGSVFFSGFNAEGGVGSRIVDFAQQSTRLLPRLGGAPCPQVPAAAASAVAKV
jgi:hypothetical protein